MTSEKHIKPEDELSRNWKTFCEAREQLEAEHSGRVVLLHRGEIIAIYNDGGDAYKPFAKPQDQLPKTHQKCFSALFF